MIITKEKIKEVLMLKREFDKTENVFYPHFNLNDTLSKFQKRASISMGKTLIDELHEQNINNKKKVFDHMPAVKKAMKIQEYF